MAAERREMLQYACYRLGNLDDAEDAVQDAFVKLHQRLNENETEVRNLPAYLYRTLANLCVSRRREAGRTPTVPLEMVIFSQFFYVYSNPFVKNRLKWRWMMPLSSVFVTSGDMDTTYLG